MEALAQARAMELRPLGLVGLISRAATIYANDAGRFIAMVFTAIVPLTVVQYLITRREQPKLDAAIAWLQQPQYAQARGLPAAFTSPDVALFACISLAVEYLILAFAFAAVGAGVLERNRNERVSYGACMLATVRHWRAILAVVAVVLVMAAAAAAAILGGIITPVAAIATIAPAATIVVLTFAVLSIVIAMCLLLTMLLVVGSHAVYAVTLENGSPIEAVMRTLRRTCSRGEAGRALVYSSIVSTIVFAATTLADAIGFALLQNRPELSIALDAMARALVLPFAAIALAVYYFDLRVRQEGYDLQMRIDGLMRDTTAVREGIRYAPTRYLTGEERAVVASFIERRESFDAPCRRRLAARIADPIRGRVPVDLASIDAEALLERL